jgi:hypothetical protein
MNIRINREQGGIRLILILFIAAAWCLWSGAQGLLTAFKNRKPTVVNARELSGGKPTADWLVLTNCTLSVADSAYKTVRSKYAPESSGRITEAYVPIYAEGQSTEDTCYAVLATSDANILAMLEDLRAVKSEAQFTKFHARWGQQLTPKRNVEGVVRFGATEHGEQSKLANLKRNLSPNYIILSEGEKPNMATSGGLLFCGLALAGGLVFSLRNKEEPAVAES